jgi:ferredoxin
MKTEIYYFTSTGNSLVAARQVSEYLGASLISIASEADKEHITSYADSIGIVFPVYYASLGGSGIPLLVERFIRKFRNLESKYIFAVCTHSGIPAYTLRNLKSLIELTGGRLSAGFYIKMSIPFNPLAKGLHFMFGRKLKVNSRIEATKRKKLWERNCTIMSRIGIMVSAKFVQDDSVYEIRAKNTLVAVFLGLQYKIAVSRFAKISGSASRSLSALIPIMDFGFHLSRKCDSCGICAKVCPVGNIKIISGGPSWQGKCETCYACYQWCPKNAIGGPIVEFEKRYHHAEVRLKDMYRQLVGNSGSH